MTKITHLFALTLGLASITAPAFAHDVRDAHPQRASVSASDRAIARHESARFSVYDLNRDGRVTPYEVKRYKEEQALARRRELQRQREAAERARAHQRELAAARVVVHDDHHFTAPVAYHR